MMTTILLSKALEAELDQHADIVYTKKQADKAGD